MDKYDKAIQHLTAHPEEIPDAWNNPRAHVAGCLFLHATPTGRAAIVNDPRNFGCLTEIRANNRVAFTTKHTNAIRADTRIPKQSQSITVDHLPIFAEWRRRFDKELAPPLSEAPFV